MTLIQIQEFRCRMLRSYWGSKELKRFGLLYRMSQTIFARYQSGWKISGAFIVHRYKPSHRTSNQTVGAKYMLTVGGECRMSLLYRILKRAHASKIQEMKKFRNE